MEEYAMLECRVLERTLIGRTNKECCHASEWRRGFAAIMASAIGMGTSSERASDCHSEKPRYCYKTIIVYETIEKPVVTWIKKYDHCDESYWVKVVKYKSVEVAVEKQIRVAY